MGKVLNGWGVFAISGDEDKNIKDDLDDGSDKIYTEMYHMTHSELLLTKFEKSWADEFITLLQLN